MGSVLSANGSYLLRFPSCSYTRNVACRPCLLDHCAPFGFQNHDLSYRTWFFAFAPLSILSFCFTRTCGVFWQIPSSRLIGDYVILSPSKLISSIPVSLSHFPPLVFPPFFFLGAPPLGRKIEVRCHTPFSIWLNFENVMIHGSCFNALGCITNTFFFLDDLRFRGAAFQNLRSNPFFVGFFFFGLWSLVEFLFFPPNGFL